MAHVILADKTIREILYKNQYICRLLKQEETRELQLKREQVFIEKELRKFEQDLQKSRPKFCGLCSRKNIASSDDENFWRTSSRIKVKLGDKLNI